MPHFDLWVSTGGGEFVRVCTEICVLTASKWNPEGVISRRFENKRNMTQFDGIVRECLMMNKSVIHTEAGSCPRRTG